VAWATSEGSSSSGWKQRAAPVGAQPFERDRGAHDLIRAHARDLLDVHPPAAESMTSGSLRLRSSTIER